MKKNTDALLKELTLEEKAGLCSGKDFWTTKPVERLGLGSWMMTDGPHGLRKQVAKDGLGLLDSVPSTCFPSGVALASTWNRALIEEVGQALGRESKANQVGVILGPAVNIKRSPLCGRNFEYLSEDPYVAGEMAKHHILGVQSQGVGTSLKHFAVNNQEKLRMTIDAIVDERTLREIYLPAFETAVVGAQPWTVMCSYNKLNGTYAAENAWLLTQVLKEEWGHTGFVVTDWGAANDRVEGLRAGEDLEMPGNGGITDADIVKAVKSGKLPLADLDRAVRRILNITAKVFDNLDAKASYDQAAHHALARRVATEAMVLLKNDGSVLPLTQKKVAFVGAFARTPRYQGGGSSHIVPTQIDDAVAVAQKEAPAGTEIIFAPGYVMDAELPDAKLIAEAVAVAKDAEVAVVFIGLTDPFESEGYDRKHLGIPASHSDLLEAVLAVQKNVVVVLSNGSPIEMPWLSRVPAVLEGYLGGQAWGGAVVDLLFGKANPSGKLAETFPARLEDTPSYLNFPGDGTRVEYREGLFVGYRHHDAINLAPLFPFGHGQSYTQFSYGILSVENAAVMDTQDVVARVTVTNTGKVAGAEVVQLYVGDKEASVLRPVRELKAFQKVFLAPGETQTVEFTLGRRAFAFWAVEESRWLVETGDFELSVGSSSRDLRASVIVNVKSTAPLKRVFTENTTLGSLIDHPVGGVVVRVVMKQLQSSFGSYEEGSAAALMMENMVKDLPLRNLIRMSNGMLPPIFLTLLLGVLNGLEPLSALDRFIPNRG
ncbi:MAG: glycoside hydrolase family 3 C-terminal domain-containing protein [Spirochaetales bacterium]